MRINAFRTSSCLSSVLAEVSSARISRCRNPRQAIPCIRAFGRLKFKEGEENIQLWLLRSAGAGGNKSLLAEPK